jgi:alpha-galactosidase
VDLSVTGKPLSVGGRVWRRGLGVHAPSRLTWDLDGEWRELRGLVGIDDEVLSLPHRGAVNFRLWLDQREVWSSGTVRGGEGVREIPTLALGGASKLTLEVDMDAQSFVADRADWLRVLLVK